MIKDFKYEVSSFFSFLKRNKKLFLIIFVLYCLAFVTIWRANVYYADDIGRAITGYGWTSDFNRYSSSALQFLLINMNLSLVDLSPYTQILALALTTVSSMILIYLFTDRDKKPLPLTVVFSTFLGLCPYTIACFVYKFDAPCMALALFATIVPFLFYHSSKRSIFFCASLVGLLIMWTSYQAYSGIYVILCLTLVIKALFDGTKFKPVLKQTLFCALPFFIAAFVFKFCLPGANGYRSTEMFSFNELLPGFFRNLSTVSGLIWSSFNTFWRILFISFVLTYLGSFLVPKIRWSCRLKNLAIGTIYLVLIFVFSIGAFLLLEQTFYPPRSLCGVAVALSMLGLFISYNLSMMKQKAVKIIALPALLLLYQFFVFGIAFGDALTDQWRYASFHSESIASSLSELFPDTSEQSKIKLQIHGDIGLSPVASHVADQYPIIHELITSETTGLSEHVWGTRYLVHYYGLYFENAFVAENEDFACESMDKLKDTSSYSIYAKADKACVVLK